MKGKLSHSMSDMEGSVGRAPLPRPRVPTPGRASLECHLWPGSSYSDQAGHSGLPLFQSACPQTGYFLATGRAVWTCAVGAGSSPAVQVTGWVSLSPGNGVLEGPLRPCPWVVPSPASVSYENLSCALLLPVSQLVVNSKGEEKSPTDPLPLNPDGDFRYRLFPECPREAATASSFTMMEVNEVKSHLSGLWAAEGTHKKWLLPTPQPYIPNLISLGIWLGGQKNTFLFLPSPKAHGFQLHTSSDSHTAPGCCFTMKNWRAPSKVFIPQSRKAWLCPKKPTQAVRMAPSHSKAELSTSVVCTSATHSSQ